MTTAFVFPGQGSQAVGMLAELAGAHRQVRETFDEASETLGYDLWRLAQEGPEETLNRTEHTQPAMLAAGVAVWRVWQAEGGCRPAMAGGHSLGEYTALVCAGSLAFADAAALVAARGRFMQEAVPLGEGAIAAILGLEDEAVVELCRAAAEGEVVSAVNFNAPGQVAVAGHTGAVERALALAKEAGAKRAVRLPLSVPVHCELMAPATRQLTERLAQTSFREPEVAVIHNVDARRHPTPDGIRAILAEQLASPVQWVDTLRAMARDGVDRVLELGPGRVLTGLNKRISRELTALAVYDPGSLGKALQQTGNEP